MTDEKRPYRMKRRAELEAGWRGIVLCVAPTEDQEARREGTAAHLAGWLARTLRVPPLA